MAILIKGSDTKIVVTVIDKATKEPYSLAGFTSATGFLSNTDATTLAVTGTLLSSDLGKIQFEIDEVSTALLASGDAQSMEVVIDQGTTRSIVQFDQVLDIRDRLF